MIIFDFIYLRNILLTPEFFIFFGIIFGKSTTILEMWLTKLYLEDFYLFCKELGGDTELVMCEILETRADTTAISITLNSFNTPLNEPKHLQDRADLYPSCKFLAPDRYYLYTIGTDLWQTFDTFFFIIVFGIQIYFQIFFQLVNFIPMVFQVLNLEDKKINGI